MSTDGHRILNRLGDLEKMMKKMKKEVDIIKDSVLRIEGVVSPASTLDIGCSCTRTCKVVDGVHVVNFYTFGCPIHGYHPGGDNE